MIFAGLIGALPGFLLKFVGSGVLDTVLSHQREKLQSANERERIEAGKEVKRLEAEQQRRETIAKLQALEYQHWALWWPKMLIGLAVAFYVVARFSVKTWGLDDFGIAVAALDTWEQGVVAIVIGYYFLKS